MDRGNAKDYSKRLQDIRNQTRGQWLSDHKEKVMDMRQYAQAESNDLKAADFKGQNLKVVISAVETRTYPAKDKQPEVTKPVLFFVGKEKQVVVSPTNAGI